MKYDVIIKPSVAKDLDKLPNFILESIFDVFEAFLENPRPHGYKKLENAKKIDSNYKALYRVRVGIIE